MEVTFLSSIYGIVFICCIFIAAPNCYCFDASVTSGLIGTNEAQAIKIDDILNQMEGGYGGTLILTPHDDLIDSAAFVQRYLRRFSSPDNLKAYDNRFARLLDRLDRFPQPLTDKRLDEDIWAAFMRFESKLKGASTYKVGNTVYGLDSARDLLWHYLDINCEAIRKDPQRSRWWLKRLIDPDTESVEGMIKAFAALQLIDSTEKDDMPQLLVVLPSQEEKIPAGKDGLVWFSRRLGVSCTLWGVDPAELRAPRVDLVNLSTRLSRMSMKNIVDQESWSKERHYFKIAYLKSVGQRSNRISIAPPRDVVKDGIFMFYHNKRLHIWPKSKFLAGVLRMLQISGFVDSEEYAGMANKYSIEQLEQINLVNNDIGLPEIPKGTENKQGSPLEAK